MPPDLGSNVRNDCCLPGLFFSLYRRILGVFFTFFLFIIRKYLIPGHQTPPFPFLLIKKPPRLPEAALYTNPSQKPFYASAAAFTSLTFALILASISLASSGLSRRSVFTESLPWPSLLLS